MNKEDASQQEEASKQGEATINEESTNREESTNQEGILNETVEQYYKIVPKLDYDGLNKLVGELLVCVICETNLQSKTGIKRHLQTTTCGFGQNQAKSQKIEFRSLYSKDGINMICNTCKITFISNQGMYYLLRKTHCGFGVGEPTQPRKNTFKLSVQKR